MPLINVAVFSSLPEAQRATMLLDEALIESFIHDEGQSADPFSALKSQPVLLQVDREDQEAAETILRNAGYSKAIEKAIAPPPTHTRTWPQTFRVAGLVIAGVSVLIYFTQDTPIASYLVGAGLVIWMIGYLAEWKS